MIHRYCFVNESYIGDLYVDENENCVFKYSDNNDLCEGARNFKKYSHIDNPEVLRVFIEERVIPRERPDRGIALGFWGLDINASDVRVFLAGHSLGGNDTFWTSEDRYDRFWEDIYRYEVFGYE